VVSIVKRNYDKSLSLLNEHIDILHKISSELLEKEVLNSAEIDEIIGSALPAEHAGQKQ
jgi:cell division protease FtsH